MIRKPNRGSYQPVVPHFTGGKFDGVEVTVQPEIDEGAGHRILLLPEGYEDSNWFDARLSTSSHKYRLPKPDEMKTIGKYYLEINNILTDNYIRKEETIEGEYDHCLLGRHIYWTNKSNPNDSSSAFTYNVFLQLEEQTYSKKNHFRYRIVIDLD